MPLTDILYAISKQTIAMEEPMAALEVIIDDIMNYFDATSASIALINPETRQLEIEILRNLPVESHNVHLALGQGITGWVALHGNPLLIKDVKKEPRYVSLKDSIRTEMAAPMIDQEATIGVISLNADPANKWNENDLEELIEVTDITSKVISKIWQLEHLKVKASQFESIVKIGQKVVSQLELNELLDNITEEAIAIMQCKACAIFLLSSNQKTLDLQSLNGVEGSIDYQEELKLEESSIGTAISRKKQVEILDIHRYEEHHFVSVARQQGLVSLLCAPIIYEDEVIGVLNAYTEKSHRFNNNERKILTALASQSAVAIHNARLYAKVFAHEETLHKNEKLTTLGLLAAEIAHEIRNPLTVIKLLFESLELEFNPDDIRHKDATIISEKLNQLEAIVSRVLNFGKANERLRATWDINELIKDTIHLVRLKLYQNKIHLEFNSSDRAINVNCCKGQLQQVILNLIINATQAMPEGGEIKINAFSEVDENKRKIATMTISDTGKGIKEKDREHIFDTFLTGSKEGSGLGLAIVKRILEGDRGGVKLVDTSSKGTSMKIWLPEVTR